MDPLWTVKEAAAFLRAAPSTVYERAARGQIPRVILWKGRRKEAIRFDPAALREFVKRNSIIPKAAA